MLIEQHKLGQPSAQLTGPGFGDAAACPWGAGERLGGLGTHVGFSMVLLGTATMIVSRHPDA
jgi:hypothetical protein